MRQLMGVALIFLSACDLLEAATAEKPDSAQQRAIGDIFAQVGTLAGVVDDPETTSNDDLADAMRFDHFARLVAPSSAKPRAVARAKPAPPPGCVASNGNERIFGCDVVLGDGRACVVSGTVTRTPSGAGNRYAGALALGGATTCPTASLTVDVTLEGPTNSPTRASGYLTFDLDDPAGDQFSGSATIDGLAITGTCSVPSAGELTVVVDGVAGGDTLANRSITLSFHDSPACGIILIE